MTPFIRTLGLGSESPALFRTNPMNSGFSAVVLITSLVAGIANAAQPQLAESMMAAPQEYAARIVRQIGEARPELQAADAALTAARNQADVARKRLGAANTDDNRRAFESAEVARLTAEENQKKAQFQYDALSAVEAALADPAEWRFHRRPRGVLVAVPVARNLGAAEKYDGEDAVVNIVHRLIQQDDLAGRVEVVFIEPAAHECPVRPTPACCVAPAIAACGCR